MTTPPNNGNQPEENPDEQHGPGSGENSTPGSGGQPEYPSYPSYPATPHPEDNPTYGAGGYGGGGYGAGGDGYGGAQGYQGYQGYQENQGYGAGGPGAGAAPQGTGRVDPMAAISWAFRAVFGNWPIWIIGTLVFFIVTTGASILVDFVFGGASLASNIFQLVFTAVLIIVTIHIYTGVLREIDNPKVRVGDFLREVNLWPSVGIYLIVQVVTGLLMALVAGPLMFTAFNGDFEAQSNDEVLALLGTLMLTFGVVMLLSLLLAPFTGFLTWYVVDRREGIGGAISHGLRDALRNYGRLLLFFLLTGVLMVLGAIITFGLALLVFTPVLLLAQAHLYRQMSGGQLPVAAAGR